MNKLKQQVAIRRSARDKSVPEDEEPEHLWGLALSGGGIRSATFCFGLLRAFASQKLLGRFDLLSTVSGGGYVGAMLGRLFSRARTKADAAKIETAFGKGTNTWFLWWLRANGRYLIPSGAKDTTFVAALFLRNLIAVHFELGLVALLLGVLLALVNLAGWAALIGLGYEMPASLFPALRSFPPWVLDAFPVVWLALPFIAAHGAARAGGYWSVPWVHKNTGHLLPWLGALAATVLLVLVYVFVPVGVSPVGRVLRTTVWTITAALLVLWLVSVPVAKHYVSKTLPGDPHPTDSARTNLTRALANSFRWFSVVVLIGLVDRCAWFVAFELEPAFDLGQGELGFWLAVAAAVVRAVLPLAGKLVPGRTGTAGILWVGRMLGYLLTFLLCVWWVSLVHKAVLGAAFTRGGLSYADALWTLLLFAVPVVGYLWISGRNIEFLNLSSLHAFYRARLVRSYLGAANAERFGKTEALGALDDVPAELTLENSKSVDAIAFGDDIGMVDYRPQDAGGPVHIVNVCINQTRDPRGGLFNQDRRGLAMAVASGGYRKISQRPWENPPEATAQEVKERRPGATVLTLGSWTAISGAAVSPGLGSLTRGGISALATFAGIRLGFWWDKATRENKPAHKASLCAKSAGILSEVRGNFEGTDGDDWFLTDGGHFENTGAYALLAERAEVIVVADCGADPKFAFQDLENLVRKARIDLQTEILFQRPKAPDAPQPPGATDFPGSEPAVPTAPAVARPPVPPEIARVLAKFGSLNDLASTTSSACLAFATVNYAGPEAPRQGVMIVIKPNVCTGLPVDLVNFKEQNPDFPQETTVDQFFSEAQWESYFHLGEFLGEGLKESFIEGLLKNPGTHFEPDDLSPFQTAKRAKAEAAVVAAATAAAAPKPAPSGRLPSRIMTATTVGATLSFGALATVGVAVYQAVDGAYTARAKRIADERLALKDLTDLWTKITPAGTGADETATAVLASALVRTADALCSTNEAQWFKESDLAQTIFETARKGCDAVPAERRAPACQAFLASTRPDADAAKRSCLKVAEGPGFFPEPRYWIYDYTGKALPGDSHPCDRSAIFKANATLPPGVGPLFILDDKCRFTDGPTMVDLQAAEKYQADAERWAKAAAPPLAPAPAPAPAVVPTPSPGPSVEAPVTAPPPAPPPPPVPTTQPPLPPELLGICKNINVFLQIYGPEQRTQARAYREGWRKLEANVPPIEDVIATARARGRASPIPVSVPTVRYHDAESLRCASVLGPVLKQYDWRVEPLNPRLSPTPRTVEVWIPPVRPQQASQ